MSLEDHCHVAVDRDGVSRYTVSTELPESDANLQWRSPGLALSHSYRGNASGIVYTYTAPRTAALLPRRIVGGSTRPGCYGSRYVGCIAVIRRVRNLGRGWSCNVRDRYCALGLKALLLDLTVSHTILCNLSNDPQRRSKARGAIIWRSGALGIRP